MYRFVCFASAVLFTLSAAPAIAGPGDPECRVLQNIQVKTETTGVLDDVRFLAFRPSGLCAYAAGNGVDAVVSYSVNTANGNLTFELSVDDDAGPGIVDGLDGAVHAVVSPDNAFLYVAGEVDDAIAVFELPDDTPPSGNCEVDIGDFVQVVTDVDLDKPRSLAIDPTGSYLYAASASGDAIVIFERDPVDGTLTALDSAVNGVDGFTCLNGVTSLAISSDGACLYAASEDGNKLCAIDRDDSDGSLGFAQEWVDAQSAGPGSTNIAPNLKGVRWVEVSSDDNFVYTAAFDDDAVSVFEIESSSGCDVDFVEDWYNAELAGGGLDQVTAIDVAPDGSRLYAASKNDDALVEFLRNDVSGALTSPVKYTTVALNGAVGVHVENQRAYVSASISDSLTLVKVNNCCKDSVVHANEECDNASACCAANCTIALSEGSSCGDSNVCTGPDTCDDEGVCKGPCNVGNACSNICVASGTCVTDGVNCGCQPN